MNRSDARALAKQTLEDLKIDDLKIFDHVTEYEPDAIPLLAAPRNKLAFIRSMSLGMSYDARDEIVFPAAIVISIYTRRTKGQGQAAETSLDTLSRASIRALFVAFDDATDRIVIRPLESGTTKEQLDGANWRVERFSVEFDDDADD